MSWVVGALLFWLVAWGVNWVIAHSSLHVTRAARIAVPVIFGIAVLVLWEGLVRGLGVSPVILPPPSAVAARLQRKP